MIDRLLYPDRGFCFICKDESINIEGDLCLECRSRIEEIHREFNMKSEFVHSCYSSLFYNNFIREAIHSFKFEDQSYLYRPLFKYMMETVRTYGLHDVDLVVPVPVHFRKEAMRGYNQAYLLAKPISMAIGKPLGRKCLVKKRWTPDQNTLSAYARKSNLKDSFRVKNGESIRGGKILLVDDILTTGSTLRECARTLKQAGAREVVALTLTSTELE